jgi:hypothetical protein
MHPDVTLRIPRTPVVVPSPVVPQTKRNNRQPKPRSISQNGYAPTLIVKIKVVGVNPTATPLQINIAPRPVVEATVDVNECVGRYGLHERIVAARPRPQMNSPAGVRTRCESNRAGPRKREDQ